MLHVENTKKEPFCVAFPVGDEEPSEYKSKAVGAILRTMKLVFERREIDLGDDDCFALYCLADLGEKLLD